MDFSKHQLPVISSRFSVAELFTVAWLMAVNEVGSWHSLLPLELHFE